MRRPLPLSARPGPTHIGKERGDRRNLNTRVEAAVPMGGRRERERLWEILQTCLNDHRQGWDMQGDGRYLQRSTDVLPQGHPDAIGTHQRLMTGAIEMQWRARREEE